MKNTRYIMVHAVIEIDLSNMANFTERDAIEYFNSALKLGPGDRLDRTEAYLLRTKPGSVKDIDVEEYTYRNLRIKVRQDGCTVGSEHPSYFAVVSNPHAKYNSGFLVEGNSPQSITDVKTAAEIYADKRVARLEKQGKLGGRTTA